MADETVATDAPQKIGTSGFYYPVERDFTGLMQFRVGAGSEVDAPPSGKWLAAEVKAIKSPDFAARLIAGGLHSHVAKDTPLGQPVAYRQDRNTVRLRELGYSDEAIGAMTPEQVKEALAVAQTAKTAETTKTFAPTEGEE